MLNPTPAAQMVDDKGHLYFFPNMTPEALRRALQDPNPNLRAAVLGRLLREAKPDDVFEFVTLAEIRSLWSEVEPRLGRARERWEWLLESLP